MTNNTIEVRMNENILNVVTPITKADYEKAMSDLRLKDKDGNDLFVVCVNKEGKGSINNTFIVCNAVVDGKLAVVITEPMGTKLEDVKKKYGKALLNAQKYIPEIVTNITEEVAAVDALFKTEETAE